MECVTTVSQNSRAFDLKTWGCRFKYHHWHEYFLLISYLSLQEYHFVRCKFLKWQSLQQLHWANQPVNNVFIANLPRNLVPTLLPVLTTSVKHYKDKHLRRNQTILFIQQTTKQFPNLTITIREDAFVIF